ncbi:alpha-amylase [Sphaerisporangium krabiense]|uniref:Maltose alpha-D-glucosyltransferase/alpha-amylase n=1 Tax=Sphaerisporangium krabiense TaxID=763782 RepID=A0A7W9DRB4_9ACTN|nr:alpha-amylase family protein [Sphaerisporangium krabiense]MBB5628283.1 maltose alpha-D-glucosyltransferase/alpha-amylase [Sphaerisporangium krabiense]GII66279.1 alpha-amylase [Sphaerisporangium krabiense]
MRLTNTSDLWWKNAVVYCLDVETYADGNGDGIGDFRGLTEHVDHLDRLGVTCLWLMPFFPTPDRDDGYDITDFYSVDPKLGTLGEFVEFMRVARDRGIRVIADLVVNHTSDEHPWFKEARSSRDSRYRDWYIWSDTPEPDDPEGVVFPDKEDSLWEFDEGSGQYYYHRFYRFQPDLNVANPEVRDEIARILGFWMELGLSGFRVDAVPFLVEDVGMKEESAKEAKDAKAADEGSRDGKRQEPPHAAGEWQGGQGAGERRGRSDDDGGLPDVHRFLRDMRAFMNRRNGSAMLLGEVNLPYPDLLKFFGNDLGDEVTMCFDFIGMQRMYLALARGEATPLAEALRERPYPPSDCHWATFVRNHDELTLDKLTGAERQEVFDAFGPDKDMQIFGRGLRRRLPPMLDGDPRKIRMVYSLLFSLPGTPVLFYGEEIGMGENLKAEGRQAVRTPMQWTPHKNGGFSTAEPSEFRNPMTEGEYGPEKVNVSAQRRDPDSLLMWMTKLVEQYRECPELAWGRYEILDTGEPSVLAHRADIDGATVLALHNFSDEEVSFSLRLDGLDDGQVLTDLLVDGTTKISADGDADIELGPYGCRWLRASEPELAPADAADVADSEARQVQDA